MASKRAVRKSVSRLIRKNVWSKHEAGNNFGLASVSVFLFLRLTKKKRVKISGASPGGASNSSASLAALERASTLPMSFSEF